MEQSDNFSAFWGMATDLKPYQILLHLQQHLNINVIESKLVLNKDITGQSFLLQLQNENYIAQIIVLTTKSRHLFKLDNGIDYLIFFMEKNHFHNIKLLLKKMSNMKGVFKVNNTQLQHYFPNKDSLTNFKPKKIAVN